MAILKKITFFFLLLLIMHSNSLIAGPPFATDDPEPVDYKHWEFYISSIHFLQDKTFSGTLPHFEVNYGVVNNVQLHLIVPMNYTYNDNLKYGYANTELGVKFRFIQETDHFPQIATFPIVEIPTINNSEFSSGKSQIYIPIWLQKSWGKLTSYGGGGYWINPGAGNKSWIYSGWEAQYDFSEKLTLGGELYYQTANTNDANPSGAFNVGGILNLSSKFHFLFSIGHSIVQDNFSTAYFGVQWTI
jgi:hypothetical protein